MRIAAMLGCSRLATTLISRMNRATNSLRPARLGSKTFMAPVRSESTFRTR